MNATEVLSLLEAHQDARGIAHWQKMDHSSSGLSSYGIGLTKLRKLAKQIGRDHDLAQQLWDGDNYDAKVVGLLIDEPKKLTRAQAEAQVELLNAGMLRHVFASCNATLAKTPFVVELAVDWMQSDDAVRRQCGYTLLYEISKDKRKRAPDDTFFLTHIAHIQATQQADTQRVRYAMGAALMGIGKRNKTLNAAALAAARELGTTYTREGCEPVDFVKHLTSDYLKKKLGL